MSISDLLTVFEVDVLREIAQTILHALLASPS
jgi:hypothetical protein